MRTSDHLVKKALGILPKVNEEENAMQQDTNIIIIEEYIKQYSPADVFGPGVIIRTTADIINELADMADLIEDEVNVVLIRHGYHPGRNKTGSFGWMMIPESNT